MPWWFWLVSSWVFCGLIAMIWVLFKSYYLEKEKRQAGSAPTSGMDIWDALVYPVALIFGPISLVLLAGIWYVEKREKQENAGGYPWPTL